MEDFRAHLTMQPRISLFGAALSRGKNQTAQQSANPIDCE
jgi:hypothetical protein